jgi:nicotinamidase-related amidase
MIVGDSISAGPGCYKKYLLQALNSNGYTNFDFVGAYTDDCGGGVRHSARSCSTAEQYTQPTFTLAEGSCNPSGTFPGLAQLLIQYRTDLLMIQLGVNDVWGNRSTDAILANYATLVQQARAQNPNVVVAVAQIQQIRPTTDGDPVFARAQQLISAIPSWAAAQSQPQSPVFVADLWTNSNTAETLDGVHPDDAGAQRMGLNWFNALKGILTPN